MDESRPDVRAPSRPRIPERGIVELRANALRMIVPPLIVAPLIAAVNAAGGTRETGRMGSVAVGLFVGLPPEGRQDRGIDVEPPREGLGEGSWAQPSPRWGS